jgi:predicted transcriptional regulator
MASAPAPTSSADLLLGALADRPGATAAELAEAAGLGRSTVAKLLASLAAGGQVVRQPGGHQHGRRSADHWTLPAAPAVAIQAPNQASAATTTAPTGAGQTLPASGRLRPSELRGLVLACLTDHPGKALSPTAIANTLDRSAGAVANALQVLAGQGRVVQTHTKPRRYAIAEASDPAVATN